MKKLARQFAISDIHGCAKTFEKLVKDIIQLSTSDVLYLLGDYVNKGPDSKGVIDFIIQLKTDGFNIKSLRGNHDQYLLDALDTTWGNQIFLDRGGKATLESFDVGHVSEIPTKYVQFISSLLFYIELEDFVMVHAGFNFSSTDPFSESNSMLNIRNMEVVPEIISNKKIIHGHIPTSLDAIADSLDWCNHHISIDAGCVYNNNPSLGHLAALEMNNNKLYIHRNID